MRTPFALPSLALLALAAPLALGGCDMPTPNAPAEPIGEFPKWGQNFATQGGTSASTSLFSGGPTGAPGPAPTPGTDQVPQQGGSLTPNQANPFSGETWGGGDLNVGKQVWVTMCARCHGMTGEGGSIPGSGVVPTLSDKPWQQRVTDKDIASVIAHGKGAMPSFMKDMNKAQIDGVIAYVRTLSK